MPVRDRRTVGELVADSDALAREALLDLSADRGPAMARTFSQVVDAAAGLWGALPPASEPWAAVNPMGRLQAVALGISRTVSAGGWPSAGPNDEQLLQVSLNLAQATARFHGVTTGRGQFIAAEAQQEIDALRAQVVHTLYVAAHGTRVALAEYGRELRKEMSTDVIRHRPWADRRDAAEASAVTDMVARFGVVEQLAAGHVAAHHHSMNETGGARSSGPITRLEVALARWDIQAHRTLATQPDAPDVVRVARVQALMMAVTGVVSQAAGHLGLADREVVRRLTPRLNDAGAAWTHAAKRWGELASPWARTDSGLVRAAAEVRAAVSVATHARTGWATPNELAGRVDLTQTVQTLQLTASAALDLAYLVRDAAAAGDHLTAPARTIGMRAQSEVEIALDQGVTRYAGTA